MTDREPVPRAPSAAAPAPGPPPPLAPRGRLARCGAGWLALALASPGAIDRDGSALLAVAGVTLWALGAHRPGRRAKLVEWATAALGWAAVFAWAALVFWGATAYMAASKALYLVAAGALLRRLAPRVPLAVAVPAAFLSLETLCAVVPPPFGMPWMRLGTHLHAWPALAGSARVWGVGGLGWVLAALAGLAAELATRRSPGTPPGAAARAWPGVASWAAGLGPLALGLLLAALTAPPERQPGPRLLLVQPGVPQARKQKGRDPRQLLREAVELTAAGLAELEREGVPPPDLVIWGETMLYLPVMDVGLGAAMEAGAAVPAPWLRAVREPADVEAWRELEAQWVEGVLASGREAGPGRRGVLPTGASFVSGAERYVAHGGRVRRQNAVVLWDADGARAGGPGGSERAAAKVHLAPSAETMHGLERFAWVREAIDALAGYVPDLLAAERTGTLWFAARDGRRYAFGASVCYDNAFDDPYLEPVRRGPVDFHLIFSNEAWFRGSHEFDQMVAFSRLAAIQSGRAVVRATNAGVTCALDADGRELARLVVDGRDRGEVAGTLAVRVPVPARESGRTRVTILARTEAVWLALWILLGPLLALVRGRGKGR